MTSTTNPSAPAAQQPSRLVWLMAGVLGTASLAAGASLFSRGKEASAPAAPMVVAQAAAPAMTAPAAPANAEPTVKANVSPAPSSPAPRTAASKPQAGPAAPQAAAPVAVCKSCGVVESVRTVTHKGEGSGIGAVAGGVLGAAVGNQMGKGDGRKAMTVLGALGGGLAGHEVEKRSKSTTVHEVQVRMDDGTLRTVQQAQAPRPGARVRVEGQTLKVLPAEAQGQG